MTNTRRDVAELWGASEVADALGVYPQNLQFIKDLPKPVQEVRATRLWLSEEVIAFAKEYNGRREAREKRSLEQHAVLVDRLKREKKAGDQEAVERTTRQLSRLANGLRGRGYRLRTDTATPVPPKTKESAVA